MTMIIPSQPPQIVTAARSGALQMIALQVGQIVDGRVVGPAPNGGTQVQIQGRLLNLALPQAAIAGDALRFEVQSSGAQIRLALQAVPAKPQAAAAPTGLPTSTPLASMTSQSAPPGSIAAPTSTDLPVQTVVAAASGRNAPTGAPQAPVPSAAAPTNPAAGSASSVQAVLVQPAPATAPVPLAARDATAATAANAAPVRQAATPGTTPLLQAAAGSAATAAQAVATTTAPIAQSVLRQPPYAQAAPANPATASGAAALVATSPSTPQAVLTQMVQTALPQQNSIVSLTAALASVAGKVALPRTGGTRRPASAGEPAHHRRRQA
ncbi:MAG: hypothetical protein MO852_04995 [Candidatus Devosia euplotis]|nr:hypothetical protein [Candidatus Devosia euplotis]